MDDLATLHETSEPAVRRLEVLNGPERRRSYSEAQKARLVAASLRPGACAARLARHHGVHPQLLYKWRRQALRGELALPGEAAPLFAAVVAEPTGAAEPMSGRAAAAADEVVIEQGDVRLRLGAAVPVERAAALVAALRAVR